LKRSNKLSFITKVFTNYYARVDFPSDDKINIIMIISCKNVSELRNRGGIIIYIRPSNIEPCISLINLNNRTNQKLRTAELSQLEKFKREKPDTTFSNNYNQKSVTGFLNIIHKLHP